MQQAFGHGEIRDHSKRLLSHAGNVYKHSYRCELIKEVLGIH